MSGLRNEREPLGFYGVFEIRFAGLVLIHYRLQRRHRPDCLLGRLWARHRQLFESLHSLFVSFGSEFVGGIPSGQTVGVGHVTSDLQGEVGQHDETRKVPIGFEFVLRGMISLVIELLESRGDEVLRAACDFRPGGDREGRDPYRANEKWSER